MPSISVYPPGLISLLGLQDQGRTPQELADFIQGTADFLDLYLSQFDSVTDSVLNGPLGAANYSPVFVNNGNQIWIVRAFGCLLEGPAAGTGRLCLAERGPNVAGDRSVTLTPNIGTIAAAPAAFQDSVTFIPGTGLSIVRPGQSLGVSIRTALTAGVNATLSLKVAVLRF